MVAEKKKQEIRLHGNAISPGIAIGTAYFIHRYKENFPEITLEKKEVEPEVKRYREALERSRMEIEALRQELEEEGAWDGAAILDAHLQMMADPVLACGIEEQIRLLKRNAESVIKHTIDLYRKRFRKIQDNFFQERFKDLQDVTRRIVRHLQTNTPHRIPLLPGGSVVFAYELAPSETAIASQAGITAFVTRKGGRTSHAAIVAKAQKIPYVTDIELTSSHHLTAATVVVDGHDGMVILHPTPHTLRKYRTLQRNLTQSPTLHESLRGAPLHTRDGITIGLFANVDAHDDPFQLDREGVAGIGLFRSESLFSPNQIPDEEAQFLIYKRLLEAMPGKPVIIRTFDIGGDKLQPIGGESSEDNPFLGCRAIRLLLREQHLFNAQLRALLRASCHGQLHILVPMVSCLSEWLQIKSLIEEHAKAIPGNSVKLGCMLEVPSAAITVDLLAKHVDFFSIGTNDLVQYTLAVDRGNPLMNYLYQPTHPSVLRLIHLIIQEAEKHQLPVTLCGEMASDPFLMSLLLGLGLRQFSMTSLYIPAIREMVSQLSLVECKELAQAALRAGTAQEILQLLNQENRVECL